MDDQPTISDLETLSVAAPVPEPVVEPVPEPVPDPTPADVPVQPEPEPVPADPVPEAPSEPAAGPSPEPAPDVAPSNAAPVHPLEATVVAWAQEHIHNSPVSRDIDAINHFIARLPLLIEKLLAL